MENPFNLFLKWTKYIAFILIITIGCKNHNPADNALAGFEKAYFMGDFEKAGLISDSLRRVITDEKLLWRIDSLLEMARRFKIDFSLDRQEIRKRLSDLGIEPDESTWAKYEERNWLEWMMIDGEKRYFNRAAGNLKRILDHQKRLNDTTYRKEPEEFDRFRIDHIRDILKAAKNQGDLVCRKDMLLDYRVTVQPEMVPSGETIRCWLPFSRVHHPAQILRKLISTDPIQYYLSPGDALHRTIYFERPASETEPAIFNTVMEISTFARYYNLRGMEIKPYRKESALYKKFTAEQYPHIRFTPGIRKLSAEIVGDEKNPYEIVRKIYYWIDHNIPWTGALEYCLMPFIPGYVLENMRGDCGMVTLLFMTLARYNRIPVRWQSGWMLHPGEVNLHDWCEVYYEDIGWVPLDMSFGLMPSDNISEREFYITGIDSYRFIVNDDIGAELIPSKKHFRSEPWDFQRGEVEWEGGNLYFNQWKYKMEVKYQNN